MDEPTQTAGSTEQPASIDRPANMLFIGPDGLRPFWGLLLYLAILLAPIMLLMVASHLAKRGVAVGAASKQVHQIPPVAALISEWAQFGFVFFATWIMGRIEGRSVFDYGLARTPRYMRWVGIGAVLGLLFQSLLVWVLWGTHHLIIDRVLLRPLPALAYGLLWAAAFLGVGFFEEFLFRGYLQFALTRCVEGFVRFISPTSRHAQAVGFWVAAVLISFGFGFSHGVNPGESPIGLVCAGCAALMFAFSLWRTGSLWWAIGLHAAWDWTQSFLFGVADSGSISADRLLSTHPVGSPLISGGATGPEGSIFVLPVMAVITVVAALTLPRTNRSFPHEPARRDPETHLTAEVNSAEG